MQEIGFRAWLEVQEKKRGDGPLDPKSVDQYITDARCVKKVYGNLDELYAKDSLAEVLQELEYAAKARKQDIHRPNPKGLYGPGYRTAVNWYREYRESAG